MRREVKDTPAERIDNRPSSRWIKHDGDFHDSRECSACHVWMPWNMNYTNYCPNCGAKMESEVKTK